MKDDVAATVFKKLKTTVLMYRPIVSVYRFVIMV